MADPKFTREVSAVGFNVRNGDGDALGGLSAVDVNGEDAVRLSGKLVDIGGETVQFTAEKEVDMTSSRVRVKYATADDEPLAKSQLGTDWEVVEESSTPQFIFLAPGATDESIIIKWLADENGFVQATAKFYEVGEEEPFLTKPASSGVARPGFRWCTTSLDDIDPNKSYEYSLSNDNEYWTKRTPIKIRSSGSTAVFGVVSDIHAQNGSQKGEWSVPNTVLQGWTDCLHCMNQKGAEFVLTCGDNVEQGTTEEEYAVLSEPVRVKSMPIAFAMGNHDASTMFSQYIAYPNPTEEDHFTKLANYWFSFKNVLVVVLNTAGYPYDFTSGQEYIERFQDIFDRAKAANPDYEWLVVSHHKSSTSMAAHTGDGDIQAFVESGLEKLFSDEGVDVVFAGHDHVRTTSQEVIWDNVIGASVPVTGGQKGTWYVTLGSSSGSKFYNNNAWLPIWGIDNTEYPYLTDGQWGVSDGQGEDRVMRLTEQNPPMTFGEYDPTPEPEYTMVTVDGLNMTIQSYDFSGGTILNPIVIDKN